METTLHSIAAIIVVGLFSTLIILVVRDCIEKENYLWDLESRATKTCYPYQISKYYTENGHELVVCKTEKGLVVREINRN